MWRLGTCHQSPSVLVCRYMVPDREPLLCCLLSERVNLWFSFISMRHTPLYPFIVHQVDASTSRGKEMVFQFKVLCFELLAAYKLFIQTFTSVVA